MSRILWAAQRNVAVRSRPRRRSRPLGVLVLAGAGVALVALPLVGLLIRAPWSDAARTLTSETAVVALRLSLVVSVSATLLAAALGVPLAWVLARASFPGRAVVRAVVILPLVLPPVVGGVGLLA